MLLPGPLSWVKKILRILKSNLTPNQIALAFTLGIFAGLPPMGMHVILPCTMALLVRCSFRTFLISMGLFKLAALAVAPGAYAVGRWLLDNHRGLDAFWRRFFHLPVVAPMGYSRYLLLGSLVLSLAIAIPAFFLVRWLVVRYRVSFACWVAGWRLSRWMKNKRGVGLARRFLSGGEAKYESGKRPWGPLRYVRREMLVGLPIIYAVCYLLAALIVPFFAGGLTTSTASWVIGSEVSVEESAFSLFSGALRLTGFSVQDPDDLSLNLLEIPSFRVNVGVLPLLSKRVVFDEVVISDVSLHVVREEDGTLNIDDVSSGWNAEGYLEWALDHAHEVDWLGLLRQFLDYLSQTRPLASREDPYARYRGGRSFPDVRPPFSVKRLEIGRVLLSLEDSYDPGEALPPMTLLEVEIANLAFPVELRNAPIEIRFHGRFGDEIDSGFELSARFEQGAGDSIRTYEFSMTRIDLPRLAHFYRLTLPVDVVSGLATMTGRLQLVGAAAQGELSVVVEQLRISGRAGRPLFGLPQATSDRVIEGINRYGSELPLVIGSAVSGSSARPAIEWEASLLDIAREGLLMLGRRELESTIEELEIGVSDLGGIDRAALAPDYDTLARRVQESAEEIIEDTTAELASDLVPGPESITVQTASDALFERLIRDLLSP